MCLFSYSDWVFFCLVCLRLVQGLSNTYYAFISIFILCMVVFNIVLCILLCLSSSCVLLPVSLDCPFFIAPSDCLAFTSNTFGVLPR